MVSVLYARSDGRSDGRVAHGVLPHRPAQGGPAARSVSRRNRAERFGAGLRRADRTMSRIGFRAAAADVAELYRRHENPLGNVCWELGGLVYIALPFALLATIPLRGACSAGSSYVPGDMLAIIFIVWANDVGAYLAGSLFGRHRLFERISPKKSWEGFAGGVLCAVAVGWLYGLYAGPGDTAHGLLWSGAGLVVAVAGVLGDLVESMLKRSAGLKDSGNSIPGHGGFLDRFDALILAVPFVYAYFAIFAYICVLSGGPVGAVAG